MSETVTLPAAAATAGASREPARSLAPYHRRAEPGTATWYLGHCFTHLAGGADTGGGLAVIEVLVRQGLEPPPHTHSREEEAYYVLEGNITFVAGDETFEAGPGSFVFLPRGVQHGFRLHQPTARILMFLAPAGLEHYFHEYSEPARAVALPPTAPGPEYDWPAFMAAGGKYGIAFAPPTAGPQG